MKRIAEFERLLKPENYGIAQEDDRLLQDYDRSKRYNFPYLDYSGSEYGDQYGVHVDAERLKRLGVKDITCEFLEVIGMLEKEGFEISGLVHRPVRECRFCPVKDKPAILMKLKE